MAHPRRPNTKPAVLERVRKLCLGLPKAAEKEAWGSPTFRARDKMFAMYMDNHPDDGRVALWIKAAPGVQETLVSADSKRFFVPPYMGPKGWIGVQLPAARGARSDWEHITDLLEEAYRSVAGKRLCAELDARA